MRRHMPRQHLVFAIVAPGAALATLDQFVVNVAYPAISHSLHGSLPAVSWVLHGYSIAFAALLVPAGRRAARNGRKAGFLAGVALFTMASAACALSSTLAQLIAARVIQAAGAALLVPSSLGLLLAACPADGERRQCAPGPPPSPARRCSARWPADCSSP
jgi:MFS family permease